MTIFGKKQFQLTAMAGILYVKGSSYRSFKLPSFFLIDYPMAVADGS